jgi:hypothetical protein
MLVEKKFSILTALLITVAILGAVAAPGLVAEKARAQVTSNEASSTNQTTSMGNNAFSSSITVSPTVDSHAKVTIEGTGLTAKQMNVNQERQSDGTIRITVDGIFALQASGSTASGAGSGSSGTSGQGPVMAPLETPPATNATAPSQNATQPSSSSSSSTTTPAGNQTSQNTQGSNVTAVIPLKNETTATGPSNQTAIATRTLVGVQPTSGAPGSNASITGSGFTPSQLLTFTFDKEKLDAGNVTTSTEGSFTASAAVPNNATAGSHQITVSDDKGETASANFTVEAGLGPAGNATSPAGNATSTGGAPSTGPSVTVSPTSASAGSQVTVQGKGFGHNQVLTLTIDSRPDASMATTDDTGTFNTNVKLPADLQPGSHQITATDRDARSAVGTFTVTAA